jgi:vacuolar-type H+-ATPase catalytic subunit A/Vma1
VDSEILEIRAEAMNILKKEDKLAQIVKLVGPDSLPDNQKLILMTADIIKKGYLQQNAFSEVDASTPEERQKIMFDVVEKALFTEYKFTTNDEARAFFMSLQQAFIDWNNIKSDAPEFETAREGLLAKISEAARS